MSTPIELKMSEPAMRGLANLAKVGAGEAIDYYVERISSGNLERFIEKSNPAVEDGGWLEKHVRLLPLRIGTVTETREDGLAIPSDIFGLMTVVQFPEETGQSEAIVTLLSVETIPLDYSQCDHD